jgi:hypothetical protein
MPTIEKRILKKQEFIKNYLYRQSVVRDPHEKNGGSAVLIEQELQSIKDLQDRLIDIRAEIQKSNHANTITVENETRTIADWLTWRREVADNVRRFYNELSARLNNVRQDAMRKGISVSDKDAGYSPDYIVNINEHELAKKIENIENVLGVLDGQLSLKNATTFIEL